MRPAAKKKGVQKWEAPKAAPPATWKRVSQKEAKLLSARRKCMADTATLTPSGDFVPCGQPRESWWVFKGNEIALCAACRKVLVGTLPAEKAAQKKAAAAAQAGLFAPADIAPIAVTDKGRKLLARAEAKAGREKQRLANRAAKEKQRAANAEKKRGAA